ncbi:MAG: extracellular solute-binding protein [Deltaproteobacteria bacterium]|nr:extracellular solute-binding protein [Deltaproteobacteria bacterium]
MRARLAVLALVSGLVLLGCDPSRGGDTLVFWALGSEGAAAEALARAYEARTPGARVRVQQVPWSAAHEKLLTAYVGGAMPDLFQLGNTWVAEFVALGALEPLDERIAASPVFAAGGWFPGAREAARAGGVTWGVPWYVDTRVLFYRADLLAAAGVPEPPATWEGWLAAWRAMKRRDPGAWPVLMPLGEWEVPVILALQRGAGLLREGGRYGAFRDPRFREALAFYAALFEQGLAPPAGTGAVANLYQDFAAGFFTAFVTGPWNLGEMARRLPPARQDDWATAPIPALDAAHPSVSIAGGACLAIRRGSPRREAAWRFVEFLSEPAQQIAFHARTGDLPPQAAAWETPALRDDPRAAAFRRQLASLRPTPAVPEWERIAAGIAREAEALVRGEVTLDRAVARLDEATDAILEKRRWLLARQDAAR